MTVIRWDHEDEEERSAAASVLADRLAASLVHHGPGWRLPRLTSLARRFDVSRDEMDAALTDLAARHLVRRLPNGQVYRASPAEYWIPLERMFRLTSYVDPMGGQLGWRSRHLVKLPVPEEIAQSLRLTPGESALAIRCLWTVDSEPGALATSYLTEQLASKLDVHLESLTSHQEAATDDSEDEGLLEPETFPLPFRSSEPGALQPGAIQIETGPPPASAARALRLAAGDLAATVTLSLIDPVTGSPAALTITILRPELFRIVVKATPLHTSAGHPDGFGHW
jgi:DNA-binding GntR family transcriptional regulator